MVKQVNHIYKTRDDILKKYLTKVHILCSKFIKFSLSHVPREDNQEADHLAKKGSPDFHQHQTSNRSNYELAEVHCTSQALCWMDRIIDYLKGGVHPNNQVEARKLQLECVKYTLINDQLYRRFYARPLTKCLRSEEATEVMKTMHKGECRTHARGRSLVMCILRQRYF
ncbi:hypothetical protein AXF42_Ash001431 [Apostasia shenzhenica]|uniref:RNase H type-1 domain-containing protein n=1 Tax=Apostasia shenzhenica TaxID=1088818 RepID=A0A2I0AUW3_9ASPA|nr:hypothetical protein AXF42_Ash001431 [Apostasia shenzhenica]